MDDNNDIKTVLNPNSPEHINIQKKKYLKKIRNKLNVFKPELNYNNEKSTKFSINLYMNIKNSCILLDIYFKKNGYLMLKGTIYRSIKPNIIIEPIAINVFTIQKIVRDLRRKCV